MPNNPATRKAGATPQVAAGNQIVRRQDQATTVGAVVSSAKDNLSQTGIGGDASTPDTSIPIGVIVMWSGLLDDIPAGWSLCDGTNGTPDLREKFVKGAADGIDPGGGGGSATHTPAGTVAAPTISSVSAGTPAGTIDNHSLGTAGVGVAVNVLTGPTTHTFNGTALPGHSHTASAPAFTGTAANFEPAYLALAFIMKTA